MKIAQIAPLWENIPPEKYGGTERIVYYLTQGLVQQGHDVTLFACGSSKTSAKLVSVYPRPLFRDGIPWTNIMYPLLNMTEAFDREKEFDIIHVHLNKSSDYLALPLASTLAHKVVITFHFPYPVSQNRMDRHLVLQKYKHLSYVSISNSQRTGGENLHWMGTVYNGVDINLYTFNPHPSNYFLWLGKFNPDKGVVEAIMAAKQAGATLMVAGAIDNLEGEDARYYNEDIKPLIDGKSIVFVGEKNDTEKNELYGNAIGFLNPIKWNEPFGLVMAESLAAGTPVISFRNGAAPEIIRDGVDGFLVDTVDQMVAKIGQIQTINRAQCRARIEEKFSTMHMVEGYLDVYNRMIAGIS